MIRAIKSSPLLLAALLVFASCKKEQPYKEITSQNLLMSGGGTTSFQRRLLKMGTFTSVVELSNGDYAFAGTSGNWQTGHTQFVLRTNARGETLWMNTLPEKGVSTDPLLLATPDNGVIVTLGISSKMGLLSPQMVKMDSLGNRDWKKAYPGSTSDKIEGVKKIGDGFMLLINNWQYTKSTIVKVNPSGDIVWTKVYTNTHLYDIEETSMNGFVLCGKNGVTADSLVNEYVMRINASGNTMWKKKFTEEKTSRAISVRQMSSGNFGICSYSKDPSKAAFFRLLDPNGASLYDQKFSSYEPACMDLTADDQFIAAAAGNMYKIDPAGNILWTKSLPKINYVQVISTTDGGFIGIANLGKDGYMVKTDPSGN